MTGRARGGGGPGAIRVRGNGTVRFRPGRKGLALRSLGGTFLVTQEGDRIDHVLDGAGEFRTRERGLVVAWALEDGAIAAREAA
ncbi:MAG TPA: hypothetical protein VLS93_12565 [Anaeromyxobacteraceae bacterium]|nr:hypothetical protein [Anaeromyxobacteraceae bacterium]